MNHNCLIWSILFAVQMILFSPSLLAQSPPKESTKSEKSLKPHDLDKLVSLNQPPAIDGETLRPVFSQSFDFNEQARVQAAINNVCKNWNSQLWFDLVNRSDDAAYCMTTFRPSAPGARNWTVGEVCEVLAFRQLTRIFDEAALALGTDDIAKGKTPYAFRWLDGQSLKAWVNKHSFKRFEDALDQALNSAISQVESDDKLSIDSRHHAVKLLKQSHAAIVQVEKGSDRVCFPWEKHSLVTKRSTR